MCGLSVFSVRPAIPHSMDHNYMVQSSPFQSTVCILHFTCKELKYSTTHGHH